MPGKLFDLDCFRFLSKLKNDVVDLFIIDPPYNENKGFPCDYLPDHVFEEFTRRWMVLASKKLKYTGSIYVFINERHLKLFLKLLDDILIFRRIIVWQFEGFFNKFAGNFDNRCEYILFYTKSNDFTFNKMKESPSESYLKRWGPYADENGDIPWEALSPTERARYKRENYEKNPKNINNGLYQGNYFYFKRARFKLHPCQKPEPLIEKLMELSSNKNDIVVDFFAGSGTTLACAKKLGRKYLGTEIVKEYYNAAIKRLKSITIHEKLEECLN